MELLILLALVIGVTLVARSTRWRSKIRMVEGGWGYIRLWPNIGYSIGGHKWSRHYSRRIH